MLTPVGKQQNIKKRDGEVARLRTDGKFFIRGSKRISINAVTYGPFPHPEPDHEQEFLRIKAAGFNAIRLYESPSLELLDAAKAADLMVFAGVHWQSHRVFCGVGDEKYLTEAKLNLTAALKLWGKHPAVAAVYVANEVPSEIARWAGPVRVREALEELIDLVHELTPWLLAAYSNYPTSEYLEPRNADFTGFNIYLENEEKFASYMARLHHLAGDRPVMLSEVGLDSRRNGEQKQAEVLEWSRRRALQAGLAGTTLFSWSDRWRVGEREELDWDFGLLRRDGSEKPALKKVAELKAPQALQNPPLVSVIICVYNGVDRIGAAIDSILRLSYPNYELIVVDDGSTDGTQELVSRYGDNLQLIRAEHGGLSHARNLGAAAARGEIFAYTDDDCEVDSEWLTWIVRGYQELHCDAMGGPNIPPPPIEEDEAVVAAAPGAPSHVMLTDTIAEHIPGCNLTVRREAYEAIGGFDETYQVAGDDVDFCWRLEQAGLKIGFHGAAFVWHRRRTCLYHYFRQQIGYGKAEALLMRAHPEKFTRYNGANWQGCVYTGAPLGVHKGSFIYFGEMGSGAYQQVNTLMMPRRPLHPNFQHPSSRLKLRLCEWLQPKIRYWARRWYARKWSKQITKSENTKHTQKPLPPRPYSNSYSVFEMEKITRNPNARTELLAALISSGWESATTSSLWDLKKGDSRILIVNESLGNEVWKLRLRLNSPHSERAKVHAILCELVERE